MSQADIRADADLGSANRDEAAARRRRDVRRFRIALGIWLVWIALLATLAALTSVPPDDRRAGALGRDAARVRAPDAGAAPGP